MTSRQKVPKFNIDHYLYFNLHLHEPFHTDSKTTFFIQSYDLNTQVPDPYHSDFFSAGLHPWNLKEEQTAEHVETLKKLSNFPNLLAIGEIGFDTLCSSSLELQKKTFQDQAELAEEIKKPLILHCVRSYPLLFEMKKRIQPKTPWIVHGFRKSLSLAKDLLTKGFFLSIDGTLLRDPRLQSTILNLPLTGLFLETDNTRDSIVELTEWFCKIKKISHGKFIEVQRELYKQIFNL